MDASSSALALMTDQDVGQLELGPAGVPVQYGQDPLQFGELSLPDSGTAPYPVLVWVHGGVWLSAYDIRHSRPLARAFADEGYAVWNLEYRRVGNEGGGWPGTFLDLAHATDFLRQLAVSHPLDLSRVVVGGHSAGGQLALWLGSRGSIAAGSDLWIADPLIPNAVLALAPAAALSQLQAAQAHDGIIDKLLGGSPQEYPEHLSAVEPAQLAPLPVPQAILLGKYDEEWTWQGRAYVEAARAKGDRQINLIELPASGHYEMINPASSTWPLVCNALRALTVADRRDAGT